ncbi:ketosteroid isomerase family protein [Shewanella sp. 3B26]|uniref:Ketosteroid isomerase family protein n=1 Tax=Shewanella zhuhaiensis TaxID=2919576 RepID=A0AAJ1BEC3_9GAMM|nr:ketosteroid isomerase family protein [Shewanella zhuhaiensis]MCH4293098.1 ketosteroid isomerase family protein [Shewanella zhuhaiensis]
MKNYGFFSILLSILFMNSYSVIADESDTDKLRQLCVDYYTAALNNDLDEVIKFYRMDKAKYPEKQWESGKKSIQKQLDKLTAKVVKYGRPELKVGDVDHNTRDKSGEKRGLINTHTVNIDLDFSQINRNSFCNFGYREASKEWVIYNAP